MCTSDLEIGLFNSQPKTHWNGKEHHDPSQLQAKSRKVDEDKDSYDLSLASAA